MPDELKAQWNASQDQLANRHGILELLRRCPVPDNELLMNLPLFLTRQNLSSTLFMVELYRQALEVHGVIMEFGVRWGRNLALFQSLRGIYEPFNHNRKIIGFDTFSGFPSVNDKDGSAPIIQTGAYDVTEGYEAYLTQLLTLHERESPISHIPKFELRSGDAVVEIDRYLSENPHTVVALAYFDFDIYEPTRGCLQQIVPHLTKGSVIGFDELNC